VSSLSFPALATLNVGGVSIDGVGGENATVDFSALTAAPGTVRVGGSVVTSIDFGELVTVGGLLIVGTSRIESIDLSKLTTVSGAVLVSQMLGLTSLSLPELTSTGTFADDLSFLVDGIQDMTTLSVPKLASTAGQFTITDNDELSSITFSALDTVGADFTVSDNPMLPCADAIALGAQATVTGTTTTTGNNACP
jgi:hypothetical protein